MEYHQVSSNSIKFHGTLVPQNEMWLSSMEFHFKWAPFQKGAISNNTSLPWNFMEYSMEFHGTLVPPNEISLSSMEFHGCLRLSFYSFPRSFPWTSMKYSIELHGTMESPNKKSPSSMGLHGIRRTSYQITQVFHGIPWNIPWNSMELWYPQMKYNLVTWNSMEFSMEFHGTLVPPNEISLSSMEFHWTLRLSFYSIPCYTEFSLDIPWNSTELWSRQIQQSPSCKWFYGIRRAPFQMTQVFHGIPRNFQWNSMELWCRQMKYHLVP